jgi:hypothetical protein
VGSGSGAAGAGSGSDIVGGSGADGASVAGTSLSAEGMTTPAAFNASHDKTSQFPIPLIQPFASSAISPDWSWSLISSAEKGPAFSPFLMMKILLIGCNGLEGVKLTFLRSLSSTQQDSCNEKFSFDEKRSISRIIVMAQLLVRPGR